MPSLSVRGFAAPWVASFKVTTESRTRRDAQKLAKVVNCELIGWPCIAQIVANKLYRTFADPSRCLNFINIKRNPG
jgi:hypothetical protein